MATPTITIQMGKRCAECREETGVAANGLCLKCTGKALNGRAMKSPEGRIVAARFNELKKKHV